MTDQKKQKQPRHPPSLTDHPDHQGKVYGVTSFPSALLKAGVDLSPHELLFTITGFEHVRHAGAKPFFSYTRAGLMMRLGRKLVAKIAEGMERRGLLLREKRGRGYAHDFTPLLRALEEAPPIDFPIFDADDRDQEIERLQAEVEALKAQTPAPAEVVPPVAPEPAAPITPIEENRELSAPTPEPVIEAPTTPAPVAQPPVKSEYELVFEKRLEEIRAAPVIDRRVEALMEKALALARAQANAARSTQ